MAKSLRKKNNWKVGDYAMAQLGARKVKVRIVEDRGMIGVGGRRILRVERRGGEEMPSQTYEMPAEELVHGAASSRD
jgi:hypothetical protein